SLWTRALLRLDDRGAGAVSFEVRREAAPDADWTGARAAARLPVAPRWAAASEAEPAAPDRACARGRLGPWALVAPSIAPAPAWEAAAAVEASASPEHTGRIDALVRLARAWEGP